MKRAILGLLALASLAIVSLMLVGAFDLTGATRILLSGGAGLLLITSLDGLRRETKQTPAVSPVTPVMTPAMPTARSTVTAANPAGMSAPPTPPVRPQPVPTGGPNRTTTTTSAVSAICSDDLVIDLRDRADSSEADSKEADSNEADSEEGARVVEQLIADGQLSQTSGPISDDDVPRIMMAALVD